MKKKYMKPVMVVVKADMPVILEVLSADSMEFGGGNGGTGSGSGFVINSRRRYIDDDYFDDDYEENSFE